MAKRTQLNEDEICPVCNGTGQIVLPEAIADARSLIDALINHRANERRRARAKLRHEKVKYGPPRKISDSQLLAARRMLYAGMPVQDIAERFKVAKGTMYRYLQPDIRQARVDRMNGVLE